jgi:hypothetical protein
MVTILWIVGWFIVEDHIKIDLVRGFKHDFYFPSYMGCHPPIDELIFFKMVIAPPTSYGSLIVEVVD